jgi:hypothetical protein
MNSNSQLPVLRDSFSDELLLNEFEFWCLTPLSAIFQLYHGEIFSEQRPV